MGTKARVRRKFQVTIPEEVRKAYPVEEGQYVSFEATSKGILITAVTEMDPTQSWFWSPRWRELEQKADADFRAGRVVEAESPEAAIEELRKPRSRK